MRTRTTVTFELHDLWHHLWSSWGSVVILQLWAAWFDPQLHAKVSSGLWAPQRPPELNAAACVNFKTERCWWVKIKLNYGEKKVCFVFKEEEGSDEESLNSTIVGELPVPPPCRATRPVAREEDSDRDSDPAFVSPIDEVKAVRQQAALTTANLHEASRCVCTSAQRGSLQHICTWCLPHAALCPPIGSGLSCWSVCGRPEPRRRRGVKFWRSLKTSFIVKRDGEWTVRSKKILTESDCFPTESDCVSQQNLTVSQQNLSVSQQNLTVSRQDLTVSWLCFPTESAKRRIALQWRRSTRNTNSSKQNSACWRSCSANRTSPKRSNDKWNCIKLTRQTGLTYPGLLLDSCVCVWPRWVR